MKMNERLKEDFQVRKTPLEDDSSKEKVLMRRRFIDECFMYITFLLKKLQVKIVLRTVKIAEDFYKWKRW